LTKHGEFCNFEIAGPGLRRFDIMNILKWIAICKAWILKNRAIFHSTLFTEKMLWGCVAAAVVCVCSDKIHAVWIGWFGDWLDRSYNLVVDRTILLWILTFSAVWLGWRGLVRIWQARSLSPLLIPISITAFWYIDKWPGIYIQTVGGISFKSLLLAWILFACTVGIAKGICKLWKKGKSSSAQDTGQHIGLVAGHPEYFEDGRKKFAYALASLVNNTNLKERGATIGITGEWGAGKTLVLKEIKSILEKRMEVIEFFPWQSSSPENLIEDFFQTLASHLHSHSRTLGRNLENYADKLIELDIDKHINFLAKIGRWISGGYMSINDARGKIEQKLSSLPKSIAVIIDDLDRLDKDELFETLRLVRNTAHFRNIAYIIAYDPAYTAKMLERKGIENAEEYLHKIFMLSMTLPSYEHFTYVGVIRQLIGQHFGKDSEDFSSLESMITLQAKDRTEFFLNGYIRNYRQAVQFGHSLCTNYLIMKEMNPGLANDFDLHDWYYLQVLRFFFPEAYDTLQRHPEAFFHRIYTQPYGLYKFDLETFNKSEIKLPTKAIDIIAILFSKTPSQATPTGIAHMRNFYNYFANRILSTEISESEFMDMINGARPKALMMTEWLHRKPNVMGSVDTRFASHNIGKLTDMQVRIYVGALLWWYTLVESRRCITSVREITHHFASVKQLDIAAETYNETIKSIIGNPGVRADIIAKLIVAQAPYPDDPTLPAEEQDTFVNLIEPEQAEVLFELLIDREFEYGRIKSTDDISDPDSTLYRLMSTAYLSTQISTQDYTIFRNYALNPTRRVFEKRILTNPNLRGKNLERLKNTFGCPTTGEPETDADNEEKSDWLIHSFFESNDNMKDIIFKWFKGSKEDKKLTIETLHLG